MYNINMSKKIFKYVVNKNQSGITIEQFFQYFKLGKDKINSLIFNKKVTINEVLINQKNVVINEGDLIVLNYDTEEIIKYKSEIKVVYEDDYILVVNKPGKMLVHSDGNTNHTLTNAVHYYLSNEQKGTYAFPVHRIDFDTTGIVVFAKDPLTLSFLSTEIENHNLVKKYVCLCHNRFELNRGKIKKNISRDRHSNKQIINTNGKEAVSYYEVISNNTISKVLVTIIHGRTHQIRVHMQSINHPILGDKLYGVEDGYDLKLHFKNVAFYHPFKQRNIEIDCKEDF